MAKGKAKPKRPLRKLHIKDCLEIKTQLDRASCGLAVAALVLPGKRTKLTKCHQDVVQAGLETTFNSLGHVRVMDNDLKVRATKVQDFVGRTLKTVKKGTSKVYVETARNAVAKAQDAIRKLTIDADIKCGLDR